MPHHHSGLRPSRLSRALVAAIFVSAAGAAFAQTPASVDELSTSNKKTTDIGGVVVTGSRIKRTQIEGPSPVTVISSAQIQREGFVTVFDALTTLTQNGGTTQNELNSAGGFTPNGSPVNLRGLGPGRTLLLINGRRAADYPFPYNGQSNFQNFGNIPSAAVDRIEILSGGASAIYGSDAVAGVINVVLKTNFSGDKVTLRGGTSTTGGGDFGNLQWVGGRSGDNWSVTYALEYFADEPVFAFQRDFMDSTDDNPRPVPELGVNQPSASIRLNRPGGAANSYIAPPPGACDRFGGELVPFNFRSVSAGTRAVVNLGQGCGSWKDVGYQTIANGNSDWSGYLYATYDFANGIEAWTSLQGFYSKSKLSGGTEAISGPHIDGTGRVTTWFDTGLNANMNMQRIFTPAEVGGLDAMYQRFTEKSLDVAFGLRGTIGDRFDWDVTVGRAEYRADRTRPRLDGSKVTDWFFGPRLNTTGTPRYRINLDRLYTPLTPAQYQSMSTILKYQSKSWVNQGSATLSGELFDLPAGPLGFAAVLDFTSQGYDLESPPAILPTVMEAYGLTGTNGGGDRDRYAAGLEFSIPILPSLKASLAGRFDKYDDVTAVDDAKTWGAGLEWRPLDSLLLRANYSTSFKAPDMHFVFNEGSGSFNSPLDTYRCLNANLAAASCTGSVYNYSMFATSKGEPGLTEETGESWGAGLVWDLTDGLSMSVDYYDIKLDDAVTTLSSTYILDNEGGCRTGLTRTRQPFQFAADSAFCREITSRVTRVAAPGELTDRVTNIRSGPVNQSLLHVAGLDAAMNWRFSTQRFGDYRMELGWTHTLKSERQLLATDPVDKDWRDDPGNFDFRSRVRGSVSWQKDAWNATVFMTRYGSLPNWQETGRIAPYFQWNLNLGKQITDRAKVTVFVNNVFNKFHPSDDGYDSYPYFYRAYSPIGREISAQLEYNFN
ncbi:TonB-dependent receptor plug domain-containing protein [Lysobacter capsici]|uniref:TonB-dependent receptor plug domain-containing protein n=2 Tax=Lysobacter capsici TaxID=435897 RepID=UPI00287B6D49|nr:TonB-dependent receptor [Lysobacter capsici]WND82508.1 TonB-dependent receptor [Lysobacter capsici]WND87704.1 TonB-dependent receptor [Lysobacter capsici]